MMTVNRRWTLALFTLLLSATGCSTSLSHATGAHTLEQGEVRGGVTGQIDINTNLVSTTLENARNIDDRLEEGNNDPLTEEEFRDVLDAAVAWALFRPGFTPEANLRVGIVENLDAGIRYNGTTAKADVKYQIAEWDGAQQAFSVDVGVGRQFSPAPSLVEDVTLTEWSRTDLDVIALYGYEFEPYGRVWIGPRFMQSWIGVEPKLSDELRERIPQEFENLDPHQFFRDENITYVGGTTGVMAGYEHVYAMVELTVMYSRFTPRIIDQERDLSGVTIAPNVGLVFEFGGGGA